jgi:hypothetical protein
MIIINVLRLLHSSWVDGRKLQEETLRRFPHLRRE